MRAKIKLSYKGNRRVKVKMTVQEAEKILSYLGAQSYSIAPIYDLYRAIYRIEEELR